MRAIILSLLLILSSCGAPLQIQRTPHASTEALTVPVENETGASFSEQTTATVKTSPASSTATRLSPQASLTDTPFVSPTRTLPQASPTDTPLSSPISSTDTPKPLLTTPTEDVAYRSELSSSAIAACRTTQPNGKSQPGFSGESNLGNEDSSLSTILGPGGKVIFEPGGPGFVLPDGSLEMKWPWFRAIQGDVVIGGRRLDAPAPPMPEQVLRGEEDGYEETGFEPSALVFPGEGCWKVTARVGEARLTFVTLVVKIPFKPMWLNWAPEMFLIKDYDLTGLPRSIRLIFNSSAGGEGEIGIETALGLREDQETYPDAASTPVTVDGQPGYCVQGARDKTGQWQAQADAGVLEWAVGGFSYRITYAGIRLACEDLLRIAEAPS